MARQEVQDRRVGAGTHQRAWCKHALPDQRNGSGKDRRRMGAVRHRAVMPEVGAAWMRMPRHARSTASWFERTCTSGVGVSRSARVVVHCGMTSMVLHLKFTSLAKSVKPIAASYRIIAERNTPLTLDASAQTWAAASPCLFLVVPVFHRQFYGNTNPLHDILGAHPNHTLAVYVNSQLLPLTQKKHSHIDKMRIIPIM